MKKIIINADDFGLSAGNNEAIKQGFLSKVITSTSLITNTNGFINATEEILPQIPDIDLGFHFNLMEGQSLTKSPLISNSDGMFNNSYGQLIIKSTQKDFLSAVEAEFREQIEKMLKYAQPSHIDSHVHTHAIPNIFRLVSKLAKEYGINYIRTQKELPYFVAKKSFNKKFALNIIKNILLNTFTLENINELKDGNLKTNDYFIGVLYTGFMDEEAILDGLKKIKKDNSVTEIIFHPYIALENKDEKEKESNIREFLITQNPSIRKKIEETEFCFTNYRDLMNQ